MPESPLDARYAALHQLDSPANRLIRASIWEPGQDVGQQSFITPRYLDDLVHRLGIDASHHVLDIGSGVGGPAVYIAEATGCRVTGIELNEVGVDVARDLVAQARLESTVAFHRGDALEMPIEDDTFDVAMSLNMANVFADKVRLFREVRRVLIPGGRFALLTGTFDLDDPDGDVLRRLTRGGRVPVFPDSLDGYQRKLTEAGYDLDEVTEFISDFRVQLTRWRDAYREHAGAVAEEEGQEALERHLAYFETYVDQIEARRAANHLIVARRPGSASH